jgi:hypothetical protein
MRRIAFSAFAAALIGCLICVAHATARAPKALATTAAEVIDRNVAARGGLDAWRKVNTMMWLGHLERGGRTDGPHIPFVMQLQRPNRTRFEIKEQYNLTVSPTQRRSPRRKWTLLATSSRSTVRSWTTPRRA